MRNALEHWHLEISDARLSRTSKMREPEDELVDDLATTCEALERFVRAHDVVEAGVISFDLQHDAVEELTTARKAIKWIKLPERQE